MLRLCRTFGVYVPRSEIGFDEAGKVLLFSYDDEKGQRDSILFTTGAQGAFLSYYFFFYKSTMSLVGFAISSLLCSGLVINAKNVPAEVSLMQDGKHIELRTYSPIGGLSKHTKTVPISEIRGKKSNDGLKLFWKNRLFLLNQEGTIHNPELLYAVLRGLNVETQSINKLN